MEEKSAMASEQVIEDLLQAAAAPGLRLGLERIEGLLQYLGNPEQSLCTVHVAGTNGKGSCIAIISAVLQAAGYNVACYLSPHIHSYAERFLFNSRPLELSALIPGLKETAAAADLLYQKTGERATVFEILTAFGFSYFAGVKPDILLVETGLGGIYDATNVIQPILSIITGIGLDHTQMLGNTLGSIAANKAGIIKEGIPVAAGTMPEEALAVVAGRAAQCSSVVHSSSAYQLSVCGYDRYYRPLINISGPLLQVEGIDFALRGRHQLNNLAASLAGLEVLREVGFNVTSADIVRALAGLDIPGRLELLASDPPVFLDVAHNPDGAKWIEDYCQEVFPGLERVLLCGSLDDKDRESIMKILAPRSRACIVTRPLSDRSRHWQESADWYQIFNPSGRTLCIEDIGAAAAIAREETRPAEYLLATGSFYIAAEVRRQWGNK